MYFGDSLRALTSRRSLRAFRPDSRIYNQAAQPKGLQAQLWTCKTNFDKQTTSFNTDSDSDGVKMYGEVWSDFQSELWLQRSRIDKTILKYTINL